MTVQTQQRLGIALGVVLAAAIASVFVMHSGAGDAPRWSVSDPMQAAVLGGLASFLATAVGALPAFALRGVSERTEGVLMGFAAGIMLAASAFSLIVPSIDAGEAIFGGRMPAALLAAGGLAAGAAMMIAIDRTLPHEHRHLGQHGIRTRWSRVWLLVLAMLIHNFPEGMAIGVAFSGSELAAGIPVATAISIQNLPEGLVVALALCTIGYSRTTAVLIAAGTGLAEPAGAIAASALVGLSPLLYPIGLALAAGAMLFVVSHELIPETHRRGQQLPATLGLMAGFAVMMVLDNAF